MKSNEITPTLLWYYFICPREVWFMARHIVPEQDDTNIALGRLIKDESYAREKKEIRIENMVIDLIKKDNQEIVVCEVKKSSKYIESAKIQLLYYLYLLKQKGINIKGELLFPKEKKKISLELTTEIIILLEKTISAIEELINKATPPQRKKIIFCRKCGYKELCYS